MRILRALCLSAAIAAAVPAGADDLYNKADGFSALASDRTASRIGDLLTVIVYENAAGSNSASTNTKKNNNVGGRIVAGSHLDEAASLSFGGNSDNAGSNARSGKMVAQIGAVVDQVLPNGDLRISAIQEIDIGGERSHIKLAGRVRRSDISSSNTILSNRITDARIEYNGKGFASNGAKPGLISRIFSWLGIL